MPNLAVVKPQPGDEITSAWGTSVADSLNGIQVGSVTVTGATSTTQTQTVVTFPRPYASPPIVCSSSPSTVVGCAAQAITTTGFNMAAKRLDGSATAYTGVYHWVAVGVLA